MPDPRDFLPPPPWEGPPIPEGFKRALRPTPEQVELICAICGERFEEYRSGEEKLLDAIFGETFCPEHR